MNDQPNPKPSNNASWAIAELMGHVALVGKLTKPGEYGGLWQIDCPDESNNGGFRTEFFGSQSVYRIRLVSEEIARAYATSLSRTVIEYSAPIITRAEHMSIVERLQEQIHELRQRIALPAPADEDYRNYDPDESFEYMDDDDRREDSEDDDESGEDDMPY